MLLLCVCGFVAHEITVYVDLQHAEARRAIRPVEQLVHSFQELLPLAGSRVLAGLGRVGHVSCPLKCMQIGPLYEREVDLSPLAATSAAALLVKETTFLNSCADRSLSHSALVEQGRRAPAGCVRLARLALQARTARSPPLNASPKPAESFAPVIEGRTLLARPSACTFATS